MNRWITAVFALAAGTIFAGVITSCAPDTSAPTLAPRTPTQGNNRVVALNFIPPTPILQPFTDAECLDCHTDQERLTTLAVAEDKSEALSSGPG
jgi:hypothetical protein